MASFHLKCSICLEIFKEPVILCCSHSFCKDCLDRSWSKKVVKKCPLCRKICRTSFIKNLSLNDACEYFVAEKRRRISAESPGVVCLEHAEKQQLFCEDDQKLVCMLCVTLDHRDHSFCSIEKAASDHKGKLQGPLQELKSKLENLTSKIPSIDLTKQKLQSKAKETERRIKKEFEKLHQFLREKEQTRISALREEEKEKIKRRDEEIKVIRDLCSDLSERIQKIEKDFKSNDGLFLHNIRDIEMRAQYTAQDPQVDSASVIDEAKHLGNLRFRVWETMKDICHYYPVILDPATTNHKAKLSEDLSSISLDTAMAGPNSPEKFMFFILGSEGLTSGRHSWEVEVGNNPHWGFGVTKESAIRTRDYLNESLLICQLKGKTSWASTAPKFTKVRVDLDMEQGRVNFTDPDTNTILQTHTHEFTEKIFPCFFTLSQVPLRILPAKVSVSV